MHEELGLLINLSMILVTALVLGYLTQWLHLSPIVGYLLAGIALGPQTPGFVADAEMAMAFAEIGVILLMFGVGLHFDLHDLLAVRGIALPGAVGQILVASMLGAIAVRVFGWELSAGLVMGSPFRSPAPSSSCVCWLTMTFSKPVRGTSPSAG